MFISFEGLDGCGKSTQIALLRDHLTSAGHTVAVLREPGGTQLSEAIRQLLLQQNSIALGARAEALLFSAARAQLVQEMLLPALKRGEIVLCDRYIESTLAYQGYGRGLPLDELAAMQEFATGHIHPDLVVLLDMPVEAACERLLDSVADRMEDTGQAFKEQVRNGYLAMARKQPERWLVVDGIRDKARIAEEITSYVEHYVVCKP